MAYVSFEERWITQRYGGIVDYTTRRVDVPNADEILLFGGNPNRIAISIMNRSKIDSIRLMIKGAPRVLTDINRVLPETSLHFNLILNDYVIFTDIYARGIPGSLDCDVAEWYLTTTNLE